MEHQGISARGPPQAVDGSGRGHSDHTVGFNHDFNFQGQGDGYEALVDQQ